MIGMWLAANAPERIDRLVLCCTLGAHAARRACGSERAATVREAGSTEPVADAVSSAGSRPGSRRAHPETRARSGRCSPAATAEGYAACCGAIERMDLRADLAAHHARRRSSSPGADDLVDAAEHQRLIAERSRARAYEIPRPAAHLANVEQRRRRQPT